MNSSTLAFGIVVIALIVFVAVVALGVGSFVGNLSLPGGIIR